jgi:hypothetical protein
MPRSKYGGIENAQFSKPIGPDMCNIVHKVCKQKVAVSLCDLQALETHSGLLAEA